jgi:5'-methylthioinosine phosphorylase
VTNLAIIGGTGLTQLKSLGIVNREIVHTPYGDPSGPITRGTLHGKEIVFLPRHGYGHTIPPHKVNYRANIWALKEAGAERVLSVAAVGGIRADMQGAVIAVPDQIVDYTWNRINTYFEEGLTHVTHIDFTYPYCEQLRQLIIQAAAAAKVDAIPGGTYAATQGPRLCYAACAVVANPAAGRGEGEITMQDIERQLAAGMDKVKLILDQLVKLI